MATISIILRTYNRADRLGRALRSALAQDWPEKQIIVLDDGSTDNTREMLERDFPGQVEYHWQKNAGLQGARLAGLQHATGEYVAYLDSDDEWHPDFLSGCMELFGKFPDVGLVFANFEKRSFDSSATDASSFERFRLLRPYLRQDPVGIHYLTPAALRELYIDYIPAPTSAMLMRRALMPTEWKGISKSSCDWMTALHMILRHHTAGAFWAAPRWIKWCDADGIADGNHDALYRAKIRTHDRQVMLDNFTEFMTPAEVAVMKADVADHNFDAGYGLALEGKTKLALECFRTAFHYRPNAKTAAAIAKTAVKGILRRAA